MSICWKAGWCQSHFSVIFLTVSQGPGGKALFCASFCDFGLGYTPSLRQARPYSLCLSFSFCERSLTFWLVLHFFRNILQNLLCTKTFATFSFETVLGTGKNTLRLLRTATVQIIAKPLPHGRAPTSQSLHRPVPAVVPDLCPAVPLPSQTHPYSSPRPMPSSAEQLRSIDFCRSALRLEGKKKSL